MSEPISFTGERFLPERSGEIWYEHWHRYALARQLSQGRCVLDVASGEGYGAAMMAKCAAWVVGVDISADAVRHAKSRYGQRDNIAFVQGSCDRLPFADASFDLAISFETIEHIETQQEFIAELARVLRPDGVLLLSSPNKRMYSDAHDYHNEFHVRELYRDELESLLGGVFPNQSWLGQKLLFHSVIWPENQAISGGEYLLASHDGLIVPGQCPSAEPMYYIVACSRGPDEPPELLNRLSLFSDRDEIVYRDYVHHIRRVIELDAMLIDREQLVAERDALLSLRTGQMLEHEKLIAERDVLLEMRNGQMEERERMIAERDALLKLRTEQLEERERMIADRDAVLYECAEQAVRHETEIAALNLALEQRSGLAWWLRLPLLNLKRFLAGNS